MVDGCHAAKHRSLGAARGTVDNASHALSRNNAQQWQAQDDFIGSVICGACPKDKAGIRRN